MPETFVLDCSVAARWLLPEPGRESALNLFARYASGQIDLIAPDLLLAEFASLIAKRCRRKQLSDSQARQAFALINRAAPRLHDTRPLLAPALELSLRLSLSVWDCVYLALAEEYTCPLLTADRRLFRSGAGRHPAIRLIR